MSPETAAHFNRLNRMTKEERDAEILRAAFGPLLGQVFPHIDAPKVARDEQAEDDRR